MSPAQIRSVFDRFRSVSMGPRFGDQGDTGRNEHQKEEDGAAAGLPVQSKKEKGALSLGW